MKAKWHMIRHEHYVLADEDTGLVLATIKDKWPSQWQYEDKCYISREQAMRAAETHVGVEVDP